jgi:glycosyltransferase involved in cell wall biosynthesis
MLAKGKICTVCEGRSFWKPLAMNCVNSRAQELLFMVEAYWHKWAKSYGQVDLFLSPSRFLAELVSKRVPSTKIRQLRNGVDLTTYRLSPGDQGYALYFGRLSREKGIETLLRAHENLRNGTDLRVIGTGPLETELREKYSHVQFLGYKEGEELKTLVANAAFVVVPSECYENCPMTVLEAMAYGKAVIGSNIGGVPEQIEDGKSGFLFEQGNAHDLRTKMTILIQDRTLRQDMGKAGRKIIEQKFSLNKHCSELLTIYEDLISH